MRDILGTSRFLMLGSLSILVLTISCKTTDNQKANIAAAHEPDSMPDIVPLHNADDYADAALAGTSHYGERIKKVAELIVGNSSFKSSIEQFTPMASRGITDFMTGKTPLSRGVSKIDQRSGKTYIDFIGQEKLDISNTKMCTQGQRVDPYLASVFNNSDITGRKTWYGLLEACLGFQESGINWQKGSRKWVMKDTKAHGANRFKTVSGFFQVDAFASQNPGMMDECIDQWNMEDHTFKIKNSHGAPRDGVALSSVTASEGKEYQGQEFSIRCGTQLLALQAIYQKNKGQCINPFATELNHFGPLRGAKLSSEIQSCMKVFTFGKPNLMDQSLADVRQHIINSAHDLGPDTLQRAVVDGKNKRHGLGPNRAGQYEI